MDTKFLQYCPLPRNGKNSDNIPGYRSWCGPAPKQQFVNDFRSYKWNSYNCPSRNGRNSFLKFLDPHRGPDRHNNTSHLPKFFLSKFVDKLSGCQTNRQRQKHNLLGRGDKCCVGIWVTTERNADIAICIYVINCHFARDKSRINTRSPNLVP